MQSKLRPQRLISEYPPAFPVDTWPKRITRLALESLALISIIAGAFLVAGAVTELLAIFHVATVALAR